MGRRHQLHAYRWRDQGDAGATGNDVRPAESATRQRIGGSVMEHDSMQFDSPLPIVHAWQDAANRRDVNRLLELSDHDVEIIGPRGTGRGHEVLRAWLDRAGANLQTFRAFVRDETVVLAQHGVWQGSSPGEASSQRDIATRYLVKEG